MNRAIRPLEFLVVAVAGWLNRDPQKVVDYLMEENRVLRAHLQGRRIRLREILVSEPGRCAAAGTARGILRHYYR